MDNDSIVNDIASPFDVVVKGMDTPYTLVPTSQKTVQPVALLRLSVFTPVSPKERGKRDFSIDASEELSSLEVARQEGYTDIRIQGAKLSMSTDFKTWVGIISAFSQHGFTGDKITIPFTEFAGMCGIASKDFNKRSRERIYDSLFNLSSIVLGFKSKDGKKAMVTHLVQRAQFNYETDTVEIIGDSSLWELYRYDHKVLLSLQALSSLSRKEAAQSLYVYLESMPAGTLYISMKRLRERLAMSSSIGDQNVTIRKALKDLEAIKYVEYSEVKKGREIHFIFHSRSPKLRLSDGS
ncbi:protein RepA [bacteria symbiont BFo2 of Frankliniella occidentalis]|nr:protein RepA [bacteria symbiont BFo2 of Frankliniella occidentalis]